MTLTGALNGILSLQFANASSFRRGKVTFDALTITGVQTVISRLDQDPSYKLHFQYLRALLRSRFDLSVNTLELDLASTRTDIDNIRAKRGYWLYWSCEITGWKSESSSQGPCADLPQGIELSVCAGVSTLRSLCRPDAPSPDLIAVPNRNSVVPSDIARAVRSINLSDLRAR